MEIIDKIGLGTVGLAAGTDPCLHDGGKGQWSFT